jgi:uncharacterized membrane protein YebE (DUF533 family)
MSMPVHIDPADVARLAVTAALALLDDGDIDDAERAEIQRELVDALLAGRSVPEVLEEALAWVSERIRLQARPDRLRARASRKRAKADELDARAAQLESGG